MDFNMVIRYRNDEESVNYDRVVLMEPFFFFFYGKYLFPGQFSVNRGRTLWPRDDTGMRKICYAKFAS